MEKTIKATVNSKELSFNVTTEEYNQYINEMQMDNKIAPAKNFLVRTVDKDSKKELSELLKLPGLEIQLASKVINDFLPDITIEMGK
ncbi:putative phage tail assembly chaperone [Endozoicomonas sp. SESOKO4]|uniref:putative phage tail assembly chaperone n=1 Tax=Endozoicomonas sp. SESOKO4 TaxID=2828745 RepID=UPI00214882FC|nr:putative phage tail assembly chaperone [Endozoicomonas sp. SESOKO4]